MPQLSISETMVANATTDVNLAPLDRFGSAGGRIRVYAAATAADQIRMTLLLGTDAVMDRGWVPVNGTAGRVVVPDDLFAEGFGAPHDPITLRLEETAGATPTFYAKVIIDS